jgi:hypothetical protein
MSMSAHDERTNKKKKKKKKKKRRPGWGYCE